MQDIFQSGVDQGFSQAVSQRVAHGPQRSSTSNIYDSRWQKFAVWCGRRNVDPRQASLASAADFLLHLFDEEKLSSSTIKGYRSAINSVWRNDGRALSDSHQIDQLLRTFEVERPRSVVVFPKWDLALVLRVLRQSPYEPLESAQPAFLARKTVFLLLLASGRRRSDIHAIDPKRITHTSSGVILEPRPGFLPKVSATAEGEARYQPIVVRKLSSITQDPVELRLCPVRALSIYDAFARRRVPDRDRFFISLRGGKSVSKNTLSAWMVKLIRHAYNNATDDDCRLAATSTHEVRALSASLVFHATYSMNDVLRAACWAAPTTFTSHYLRDVSGLQGRLHVLGPCIVGGKVLR
jgi:hypothetical protein